MPPKAGALTNALRAEKPAACSWLGPVVEQRVDGRREGGALDRNLAVGLDEHEQDVLAAQTGQQPVARGVAEAVVADLVGEDGLVVDVGLHRADLVDDEAGGARGGDGRVGEELRAGHRSRAARRRRAPRPPVATDRRLPAATRSQPKHRQGRERRAAATASATPPTMIRFACRAAERGAQRFDADPERCPSPRSGRTAGRRP